MVKILNTDFEAIQPTEIREKIKLIVNRMGTGLSKEEKMKHAKLLIQIFEEGMLPKEAMGISDAEIAQIYCYAYRLFSSGLYKDARGLFEILQSIDPDKSYFSLSLGVCLHKMQEYEKAVTSYIRAALFNQEDPVPYFYAYDCYINLKSDLLAYLMIKNAIKRAGNNPKYAALKAKAEILADTVRKRIDAQKEAK